MSKKILIVEDEPIIATDIRLCLTNLGYQVIGVAYDSETGLDMVHSRQPDLVMLDVNIEGTKDGIEVAEIIKEKYQIPFIFLTSFSDEQTLSRAKETLPAGYLVKPFEERDLKTTVAIALHNFDSKKGNESFSKQKIDGLCLTPLSEKEFMIIEDVIKGLSSNQIATNQFVSVNTVKFHLKNIYGKLDVKSKAELMAKIMAN